MIKTKKNNLKPINYLRFIPPELRKEAKDFINFVTNAPFQKPKSCPYCHSESFRIVAQPAIVHYKCRNCKRCFTPLTGTPLSYGRYPDEWGIVAQCFLAGLNSQQCVERLSGRTIMPKEQPLGAIMADRHPELHQWWLNFRYELGNRKEMMPPQVQVQTQQFEKWLHNLVHAKVEKCSYCQSKSTEQKNSWADYYCNKCQRRFSQLHNTYFTLSKHMAELPTIYDYLLKGLSDKEIMVLIGDKSMQIHEWRKKVMLQLHDLELSLLADWIEWKRFCYLRGRFSGKSK